MKKSSLYKSMDDHFDKINSKRYCNINFKEKKPPQKNRIVLFFKKIKEYFLPSDEFETKKIDSDSFTVVNKIDKGFKYHKRKIISFFKDKKPRPKKVIVEEDIDPSLIKEVIRKNKKL